MKKSFSMSQNRLLMIFFSILSFQSHATTHYVTPTGTAAFIVSSEANPMSLQYGLWSLLAGDSLLLNGTFPRTAEIYLATEDIYIGSWGTGAIIQGSADSNTVGFNLMTIVDPTDVTIEDITFTQNYGNNSRGIFASGEGDALLIQNCTFTNIGYVSVEASTGTSVDGAHGIIVVRNEEVSLTNVNIIGNTMHDLITGYSESLTLTGNVVDFLIEGNTLYDITNIGIDVAGHFSWVVDADDGADLGALNQARNGTIRNNTVTNAISPYATSGGIYCDGCKDVVIEQNVVSECGAGISLGCEVGGGKTASGIVVKNNVFRDNQESGLFLGSLASEASAQGASSVDDCVVRNNTFYKNAAANSSNNYEVFVQNSVNNDVYNNIFYLRDAANGLVAATGSSVSDFIVSYNMFYRESGVQTNLVISSPTATLTNSNFQWGDPGFTTVATDDVFEIGTSSLAVNNGDPSTSVSSGELDLDGDARIQGTISDIGAQESNVIPISNLTSLTISDDASNLTLTVLGIGIAPAYNVFIDIDNNAATGYSDGLDIAGADFYISAGLIYTYSATAPAWGWTQTTGVVVTDVAGVSREFSISRLTLELTSSGATINSMYQNTLNFVATDVLPVSGMMAYTTVSTIAPNIWNGSVWSYATTPNSSVDARIDADYSFSTHGVFETNDLTISTGATLTIDENVGNGSALIVNGDLHSDGLVHVVSGASLVTLGQVTGTGYQIDRMTTFDTNTGRYSIVGSPVANSGFDQLGVNAVVYGYDEAALYDPTGNQGIDRFKTPAALNQSEMSVGEAYFSAFTGDADGLVSFSGTPNTGLINVPLSYTNQGISEETAYQGFNLVSNPYPAAIEFTSFMAGNTGAAIDGSLYFWDDNNSNSIRGDNSDYLIVNAMGNTDSRSDGLLKWDGYIRSGQGFFVKANAVTSIDFTNSMRVVSDNSNAGFFRSVNTITAFKLLISDADRQRATVIGFAGDATEGSDRNYDAHSLSHGDLEIYSLNSISKDRLAIQGLPYEYKQSIDLGFMAQEGSYTLSLSDVLSEDQQETHDYSIFKFLLTDHLTNKVVDLKQEAYSFTTMGGSNESRFSVKAVTRVITEINDEVSNEIHAYILDGQLHLVFDASINREGQLEGAKVKLVSLTGRTMMETDVNLVSSHWQADVNALPKNIYVLLVQSKFASLRTKVINR